MIFQGGSAFSKSNSQKNSASVSRHHYAQNEVDVFLAFFRAVRVFRGKKTFCPIGCGNAALCIPWSKNALQCNFVVLT
jgi:hypothetical protein